MNISDKDAICYLSALKDQIRGKYKNDEQIIASIDKAINKIKEDMAPEFDETPVDFGNSDNGFIDF